MSITQTPLVPASNPAEDIHGRPFVVVSEIAVPAAGAAALEAAFTSRLGEVDAWPGFLDLQVWKDTGAEERYVMVSWWATEADFKAYMRSDAHRRSHERIPRGDQAPRGAGVRRFEVVAR